MLWRKSSADHLKHNEPPTLSEVRFCFHKYGIRQILTNRADLLICIFQTSGRIESRAGA